jgi:hypothetical protein
MDEMQLQPITDGGAKPPLADPGYAALVERVAGLEKQVALLPPQVRMLTGKIDGLSTAIAEPRLRSLLNGLLGIFDLIDQVLRTLPADETSASAEHRRNYEVLLAQIGLLLQANGLYQIPAAGSFDPQVHRALQTVPVDDPAKAGAVLEIVRPGFRTDQAILRYAEVTVGRYAAPAPAQAPESSAAEAEEQDVVAQGTATPVESEAEQNRS